MGEDWEDRYEPGGLTQGPEERLEREIARSKNLKVERLQLRDRVASLEEEVRKLKQDKALLTERLAQFTDCEPSPSAPSPKASSPSVEKADDPESFSFSWRLLLFFTSLVILGCLLWQLFK